MKQHDLNTLLGEANRRINQRNGGASGQEFGEQPLTMISTEKAAARGTLVALELAGMLRN